MFSGNQALNLRLAQKILIKLNHKGLSQGHFFYFCGLIN
jgi:hypothetical protein